MGLLTGRMELLSAAALLLLAAGCAVSPSHFLRYYYLELSEPNQEPQFFIRGYLDEQPIVRFNSVTRKMEPLMPWMEEGDKENFLAPERVFRADLQKLSKLNHQTEGLHTWQAILGCELRKNGSKGGHFHYGYNGMDFISFDKETLKWVADQPQAKEEWEDDPRWSHRNKDFLEKTCIEWLQRYLSYRNKTLQRTEPPVGKVTHKVINESLEVLTCQAFGFYPKKIQVNWTRDGKVCKDETLHRVHRNVTPNSDGTYYLWLSIDIDPKERDRFGCLLEHKGLQRSLVFSFKEETATVWWIIGAIGAFVLTIAGIVLLIRRSKRCKKKFYRKAKPSLDDFPSEILISFPPSGTEDERLSESTLQSESTLDDRASDGGWCPPRALEIGVPTLRRREGSSSSDEQQSQKKAVNGGQKPRKGLTTCLQKR